jgi:ABC-2 type transport system permease protein
LAGIVKLVRRLIRLWALYARMDLLWITRDVKLFLSWTISDTLLNVGSLLGMLLLAERFAGIGSWSKIQVLFLLSYAAVAGGIIDALFNYNVSFISRRIGRGQMDHVLIQPQPIWMALGTEGFCPFSGAVVMVPGLILIAWVVPRLGMAVGPAWFAALAINLVASAAITMAFQFTWGSLAFWAPRAAEEINSSTSRLLRYLRPYPLDGLGGALTGGLLSILPVGFLGWLPSRALLGLDARPWSLWATPLAAACFLCVALAVFRKGMVHYGRTGSQRYLRFGHRS